MAEPSFFAGAALARLCHHRWAIPVIAQLHQSRGAKFVTLVQRLGVGRDSLTRTLKGLDELNLAVRNPGYGHPMRPEYVLTSQGNAIGSECRRVMQMLEEQRSLAIGLKKWSLPVLHTLSVESLRFTALSERLEGSTPRAVTSTLKGLCTHEMVTRTLIDAYPPVPLYEVAPRCKRIVKPLGVMAKELHAQRGSALI